MEINRRNFIDMATKVLAGAAAFSFLPEIGEASKKIEVPEFKLPSLQGFQSLDNLSIGRINLDFTQPMDVRAKTSAIVIHHAGMRRDEDLDVPSIHDIHLGNGWAGIGYHYVIHKDGFIEQGRPLKFVGAHAWKNNGYTVGICMTGNFDLGQPTFAQALATEQLVAALCKKYKIKPTKKTIVGHRDLNDTSCPGANFYPYLPKLIKNVKKVI